LVVRKETVPLETNAPKLNVVKETLYGAPEESRRILR
jgi:hypothetical protein